MDELLRRGGSGGRGWDYRSLRLERVIHQYGKREDDHDEAAAEHFHESYVLMSRKREDEEKRHDDGKAAKEIDARCERRRSHLFQEMNEPGVGSRRLAVIGSKDHRLAGVFSR